MEKKQFSQDFKGELYIEIFVIRFLWRVLKGYKHACQWNNANVKMRDDLLRVLSAQFLCHWELNKHSFRNHICTWYLWQLFTGYEHFYQRKRRDTGDGRERNISLETERILIVIGVYANLWKNMPTWIRSGLTIKKRLHGLETKRSMKRSNNSQDAKVRIPWERERLKDNAAPVRLWRWRWRWRIELI